MIHSSLSRTLLFFLSVFLTSTLFAQDRQGNIVEYFGKEKVEGVREGSILHIFQKGLLLPKRGLSFGPESVLSDPIVAEHLLNASSFKEGESINIAGQELKWEAIQVGDKNEFTHPSLRSGYLYLEYEAEKAETVLLDASGHTMIFINGFPHEGDHYDFGWQLIPLQLKKGKNTFLLTGGRFSRMRARLLKATDPIQLTTRDLTLPDILIEETEELAGAIRVLNTKETYFSGAKIVCTINKQKAQAVIPSIAPMSVRKVPFKIPFPAGASKGEKLKATISLINAKNKTIHTESIELQVKSKHQKHKRTLISGIDGSVQYYSVAPSSNPNLENPAMFLSVHGASVEAVNQANAYQQKDWGHVVAPTNRRPFGFAWEDWGRLDALEVLSHAEKLLGTDPQRTYLTGHSMGGHGTWYLGATYPGRFAAIAPCAGYPDLLAYRGSFSRRLLDRSDEELARFGYTRAEIKKLAMGPQLDRKKVQAMDAMIRRAGNPSRTLKLIRNYLHHGVYILHGEDDTVVPTFLARDMRKRLGEFHNDFTYYEYPNGTHWYGDHSMDWPPIFDFFQARKIEADSTVENLEFNTASPGVSEGSYFIKILQQNVPFEISSFEFERSKELISISTKNVASLVIDFERMYPQDQKILLDEQRMDISGANQKVYFLQNGGKWEIDKAPSKNEKGPHRNGGFKDAFRNNFVLVYSTQGTGTENEWYYQRALQDAEKFWYRANGNVELIRDQDFDPQKFPDRNVIIYGNQDNNSAWDALLSHCPVQVSNGNIRVGDKSLIGNQWGAYFIYPRSDSDFASIGVVTATGTKGMKGAYANDYLVNGTTFPDLLLFDHTMMQSGLLGVECSGFFGNDWSVVRGDFVWR